jgi:hypothetical protein
MVWLLIKFGLDIYYLFCRLLFYYCFRSYFGCRVYCNIWSANKSECWKQQCFLWSKQYKSTTTANYNYIDHITKGNELQKGFIAQEVERILPEAVSTHKDFIPDIFALSSTIQKNNGLIQIELPKNHELKVGDKVRLILESGQEEVLAVNSLNTFSVELNEVPENIFLYSKEADDFRAVDYNYIFLTGIGAIQELIKENEQLKNKVSDFESRLFKIEAFLENSSASAQH